MNSSTVVYAKVGWRPVDQLIESLAIVTGVLAIFTLLADIPKISLFPVSPRFFLFFLSLALFSLHQRRLIAIAIRSIPIPVALFMAMLFLVGVHRGGLRMIVASVEGPLVFVLVFLLINVQGGGGARRFTRWLGLFYIASGLWMIFSLFISQPFAAIREFLYAGHLERFAEGALSMATPTGFTFNHFAMGYQLSVGFVLTSFMYVCEKRKWKLFWLIGSLCTAAAVIFSAQRSAILAVSCVFAVFLIKLRKFKTFIFLLALAGFVTFLIEGRLTAYTPGIETMGVKLKQQDDYLTRLRWQLAAIQIVAEHPLGNISSDLDWQEEALEKNADFNYYDGNVKFIHNTYLGDMFNFGWAAVILIMFAFRFIIKRIVAQLSKSYFREYPHSPWAVACVAALCAVLIQALFHNAGLFSVEPSTWVIFSACCAWNSLILRNAEGPK